MILFDVVKAVVDFHSVGGAVVGSVATVSSQAVYNKVKAAKSAVQAAAAAPVAAAEASVKSEVSSAVKAAEAEVKKVL